MWNEKLLLSKTMWNEKLKNTMYNWYRYALIRNQFICMNTRLKFAEKMHIVDLDMNNNEQMTVQINGGIFKLNCIKV